jgi:parallel beta-helix repeat protein
MKKKAVTGIMITLLMMSMLSSALLLSFMIKPVKGEGGLVGYWKFDEGFGYSVIDSSGNGNSGTLNNGPTWVNGRHDKALSFDGVDDFVLVQDSPSLHFYSAVTVEVWAYLPIDADYAGDRIISKTASNGGTNLILGIWDNAGHVWFGVGYDGGFPGQAVIMTSVGIVPRETWTHVAATYDGSTLKIYIDGVFDSDNSFTGGINTDNGRPLTIGKNNYFPYYEEYWFNGVIDDARMYNRALSQQEIQADMNVPPPSILNIGVASMPLEADPATAYSTASIPLIQNVYEPLIGFARNMSEPDPRKQGLTDQFVPKLAKDLPTKEVITLDLYNATQVNWSNLKLTKWNGTDGVYRITGWRDNRPDDILGIDDAIYAEKINPETEEWIPCTKFAWQVKLKETLGSTIHLRVTRNWYIFELRQGVKIHPWKYYNGTLAPLSYITCEDVEYSFERSLVQDSWSGYMLYKPILDATNAEDGWNTTYTEHLTELARLIDCAIQQNGTHVKINVGIDFPEIAWYQILSQTCASIVPKAFAIDHGCWPGTFFNATEYPYWIYWRTWPNYSESPLDVPPDTYMPSGAVGSPPPPPGWIGWANHTEPAPVMCGTGPYMLTEWNTVTKQCRLDKFDAFYWGGWDGFHLDSIIVKLESDWNTRKTKFLNGEYDIIVVPRAKNSELLEPNPPFNPLPGIVCYKDLLTLSGYSLNFQFEVTAGSDYIPTIGGVNQSDFFGNVHARKAFAYALNFTQYLEEAWLNEAEQPATWHISGLSPDYRDSSIAKYDLDFDRMVYHLKNANFSGGSLWDTGFHVYLLYNQGNDQRRIACEMIEYNIEHIPPEYGSHGEFFVDVVYLPFGDYMGKMQNGYLPVFQVGWLVDFADADNFARPFMHSLGEFSSMQRYNNATVDMEIDLACKTPDGPDRRDLYYDLQRTFINECPSLMLAQPYTRFWCRDWVHGWYYNPLWTYNPYGDFYNMWKEPTSTRYEWPMFHQNLRHTGYSESPAPTTNKTQWTYTTGDGVYSSPAVADGKVYVGSLDGKVYCLDALTGAHIWNYTTGQVYSSPAVSDGRVYVGSYMPFKVYCLDAATGAHIWNYTTGGQIWSSPAVADGKVYVGSLDNKVYCLDAATGAHIWSYTTGYMVESSPAVADGKVYVGSMDKKVYCLDASTGAYIWNYTTKSNVRSSPAVADGKLYVGSPDGKVYCLDASTGAHVWTYTTSTIGGGVSSSPAVADGKVYVGSSNNKTYCLDASTGAHIWSYTTDDGVQSSPAVADGMVFIGSYDGKVYAFGNVIRVPEDYPTLGEAVNAATPGATILIDTGVYYESIVINKTLTILGKKGSGAPTYVGGGSGIAFTLQSGASGTIIVGIVITNYAQGIFIDGASNCKIYNNIMTLNVNSGIAQGNNAANNLIYSNIFQQNPGTAINLTQHSTSNTIYNNTIILNSIGLNIESSGNTIYWNIFIDNTKQVQVEASLSNNWDNGYPDGGNYWSNHPNEDLYSGPLQNIVGSDGINDTQCTIAVNNIDHYPLVKPFSSHDIGITNVIPSKTIIGQGFTLRIDLKILNYGIHNELFTVTVYANTAIIITQTITLTRKNSTTITLTWNTMGIVKGYYTISAVTDIVQGETDTSDNTFADGIVRIGVKGDLNGDNKCNLLDLVKEAGKFGAEKGDPHSPPAPKYDPNYDFNDDNKINLLDLVKLAGYFGTMDP